MATFKHARICRKCGRKRRLDVDNLECAECNGRVRFYEADESPAVLHGRWVPNGRGTMDYVEDVAS